MNTIDTSQLLQQIRTMGADLQPIDSAPKPVSNEFGDLLKNSLNAVNDAQQESKTAKAEFLNGTGDKSLAEVMVASQKANLSFRAVTEVRNKLVTAYQDIMNMPV